MQYATSDSHDAGLYSDPLCYLSDPIHSSPKYLSTMVTTSTRVNTLSLPELSFNSGPRGETNGPTSQGRDERSRTNPSTVPHDPPTYHAPSTTVNHSHRHSGSTPRHSDAKNSRSQGNEEADRGAERAAGPQISDEARKQETVRGGHESPTSSGIQRGNVAQPLMLRAIQR
jgi:hypothetical protein